MKSVSCRLTESLHPMSALHGACRVDGIDFLGYPVYHVPSSGEIFYEAGFERPVALPAEEESRVRAHIASLVHQG